MWSDEGESTSWSGIDQLVSVTRGGRTVRFVLGDVYGLVSRDEGTPAPQLERALDGSVVLYQATPRELCRVNACYVELDDNQRGGSISYAEAALVRWQRVLLPAAAWVANAPPRRLAELVRELNEADDIARGTALPSVQSLYDTAHVASSPTAYAESLLSLEGELHQYPRSEQQLLSRVRQRLAHELLVVAVQAGVERYPGGAITGASAAAAARWFESLRRALRSPRRGGAAAVAQTDASLELLALVDAVESQSPRRERERLLAALADDAGLRVSQLVERNPLEWGQLIDRALRAMPLRAPSLRDGILRAVKQRFGADVRVLALYRRPFPALAVSYALGERRETALFTLAQLQRDQCLGFFSGRVEGPSEFKHFPASQLSADRSLCVSFALTMNEPKFFSVTAPDAADKLGWTNPFVHCRRAGAELSPNVSAVDRELPLRWSVEPAEFAVSFEHFASEFTRETVWDYRGLQGSPLLSSGRQLATGHFLDAEGALNVRTAGDDVAASLRLKPLTLREVEAYRTLVSEELAAHLLLADDKCTFSSVKGASTAKASADAMLAAMLAPVEWNDMLFHNADAELPDVVRRFELPSAATYIFELDAPRRLVRLRSVAADGAYPERDAWPVGRTESDGVIALPCVRALGLVPPLTELILGFSLPEYSVSDVPLHPLFVSESALRFGTGSQRQALVPSFEKSSLSERALLSVGKLARWRLLPERDEFVASNELPLERSAPLADNHVEAVLAADLGAPGGGLRRYEHPTCVSVGDLSASDALLEPMALFSDDTHVLAARAQR